MNSSYQGNDPSSKPDNYQGESANSGNRQSEQNFILIDPEQGLHMDPEEMILGQVRRLDRVQQQRESGNQQQGNPGSAS